MEKHKEKKEGTEENCNKIIQSWNDYYEKEAKKKDDTFGPGVITDSDSKKKVTATMTRLMKHNPGSEFRQVCMAWKNED